MKIWLLDNLICPECIPSQNALKLDTQKTNEDDIIEGQLICPGCGATYFIRQGVAVIVPEKTRPAVEQNAGYNSESMHSAYLWSHYSEFFNGPDATDAYQKWAGCFTHTGDWALDIGCAVGRLSFEMSRTHHRVVGVDTSLSFIREARNIMADKKLDFDLIVEGRIKENRRADLDPAFQYDRVEFIVADAMALPFRSDRFDTAASVNILEKVPDPQHHLKEINRILSEKKATFLFSDPFSWDEAFSHPDLWISGRNHGPFKGRGMDNLIRLLEGEFGFFTPGFTVEKTGSVLWKIRKTENLREHITSQFVIAQRNAS